MTSGTADQQRQYISVRVCAVYADRAIFQTLAVPVGSQLGQIRAHSGLEPDLVGCWDEAAGFAVYGEKRTLQSVLHDGDRVEILRPLRADPKEARRLRAKLKGRA